MICGTLTLRYLFRIVLSGAVAKGEDFITSGSVTRQGIFSSGNGDKYFPIALPNAVLGIALSIGHGASDPAFYSALTTRYVTITDAKGAVSIIVVGW